MIPNISSYDIRADVRHRGSVYPGDAEPASLYHRAESRRVLAAIRRAEVPSRGRQQGLAGKLRLVFRLGQ